MTDNPLLVAWTTPHAIPPFDLIEPEHFAPAFAHAMQAHLDEIAAIGDEPAPPTFTNTIEALQSSGRGLDRVAMVFSNLVVSQGGAALETIETEMSAPLAQHGMRVVLDPALFRRIDALHTNIDALDLAPDQRRLLERMYRERTRSGAALTADDRARMAAISERLAVLHTQFGQNVLHDEKNWFLPLEEADLAGLPDFVRDGARQAGSDRDMPGHILTLSRSLVEPFLCFAARHDLREIAYKAWIARGTHAGAHDNFALIGEIVALRQERARLLGYKHFADFRLADSMAASPEAASQLLHDVWRPALVKAALERDRLLQEARAEGFNGELGAWDWRYYAEKVRARDYGVDEAAIKPYFLLDNIQQAAFDTAGRLFGLRFTPRPDMPAYHPDVHAYEVSDDAGHIGIFLADHYARPDKRSGAWMSSYRDQENFAGAISPVIVNNNNFVKSNPTLLSFDDARTLFHEFGHALHGLLSQVRYPLQSGTSVKRDFVEFPSQIFEHWLSLPETLGIYARHYETGEPIPAALIDKLLAAENFNQGFRTVEYTSSAMIDLALHSADRPPEQSIEDFERGFLAHIGMPPEIGLRHRLAHFQHLFAGGGYAAGYYAYLWAEVLDADGFEAFRNASDPFDPALAARLRAVLSAGDTQNPMTLYEHFRGRPPTTEALLRGRDLLAA